MPKLTSTFFCLLSLKTQYLFCFNFECKLTKKELPNVERADKRGKKLILIFSKIIISECWCLAAMIYDAIKLAVVKLALGVINETFYFLRYVSSVRGDLRESHERHQKLWLIVKVLIHFWRFFFFFLLNEIEFQGLALLTNARTIVISPFFLKINSPCVKSFFDKCEFNWDLGQFGAGKREKLSHINAQLWQR